MVNYTYKQPFLQNMLGAVDWRIKTAMQQNGMSLPCHVLSAQNNFVTVSFDVTNSPMTLPQITIPIIGPQYIRYPIQPKDAGFTIAADVYLGNSSGLTGGTAPDFGTTSNLTSVLVFVPISNVQWALPDDPNKLICYGPNGVEIRDTGSNASIVLDKNGTITLSAATINIGSDSSTVKINGKTFLSHQHGGVQTGGGNTGGVSS